MWSCPFDHGPPLMIPSPSLLSVSKTWHFEALRCFFANYTFVFNVSTYVLPQPPLTDGNEWGWAVSREPHATRLLDFVDRMDWKDTGSTLWRNNFSYPNADYVDRYRHTIKSLALIYQPHRDRGTTEPASSD